MCEYCDNERILSTKKIMNTKINMKPITIDIIAESLHVNLNGIGATCKINYCPMCGKPFTNYESPKPENMISTNRILPEGFFCVELSDSKTLAVYFPDGKHIVCEKSRKKLVTDSTGE